MNIFVMNLEPIDTRYTGQWAEGLPREIERAARAKGLTVTDRFLNTYSDDYVKEVTVCPVAGELRTGGTTAGAFLDFAETNLWKNEQMHDLTRFFRDGIVKPGDKVLFPDAWHPGVIQTKYMSELLDIPVEIHVMWHAGSYDPQDFLGRKVKDKRWSLAFERSVYHAADFNYFATHFHAGMFENTVLERHDGSVDPRTVISGQPHAALVDALEPFRGRAKKRQILFPHRVAPEKQPEIFRDLAQHMPDVTFVVAQDTRLTKDEYHELLAESAIVFSANLQETLGISSMEAVLVGSQPYVPWRLSYREMYQQEFTYPPDWSIDFPMYELFRNSMVRDLYDRLDHPERYTEALEYQRETLLRDYLSCEPMLERLLAR